MNHYECLRCEATYTGKLPDLKSLGWEQFFAGNYGGVWLCTDCLQWLKANRWPGKAKLNG